MNAQLIRNIFGYKEFCTKTDQKPKRRSLFMLVPKELFLTWVSPKKQVNNHVFNFNCYCE